jgi:hypothetical protein
MGKFTEIEKTLAKLSRFLSSVLGVPREAVDYEIQDGGRFFLFSVVGGCISSVTTRLLIHEGMNDRLKEFGVPWMIVVIDADGAVIDEIDSIAGY